MKLKTLPSILTCGVLVLTAPCAPAALLQASFEGIATGSHVYSLNPNESSFDGEVVSGTFSIDPMVTPIYSEVRNRSGYFTIGSKTAGLTVYAHGLVSTYGSVGFMPQSGTVTLTNNAVLQETLIGIESQNPYHNALIQLEGPLFSGIDLSTLQAGEVDLSRSFIGFFDSRAFGSGVTLTSVSFATSVPEPAIVWLMLLGVAALPMMRAHRSALDCKDSHRRADS